MIRARDRPEWWLGVWGVKRVIGRLLVALAVAFPVTIALAAGADGATPNASGPAALHCGHWEDAMRITPGVGNTPANQSVTARGKLFGCTKAGGGAQYSATLQMSQATCGNLAMSGTASFDWVNGSHSTAFLMFHPQAVEPNKVYVTGSMTSGMFQGLVVNAWLRFTQVYTGTGAHCSPTNLLQHIDFTNSQSFQLLTPLVTTTTQPPGPPTSSTAPYDDANDAAHTSADGADHQPGRSANRAADRRRSASSSRAGVAEERRRRARSRSRAERSRSPVAVVVSRRCSASRRCWSVARLRVSIRSAGAGACALRASDAGRSPSCR